MVDKRASDLFFTSYAPIKIKIEGQIFPVNKQMLTPEVVRQAAYGLMTQEQIEAFNEELEIDFAIPSRVSGASASTFSISAATRRWCCVTSPPTCRVWRILGFRRS
jgi:Tfp pilus assembly protein, ATPase PilU